MIPINPSSCHLLNAQQLEVFSAGIEKTFPKIPSDPICWAENLSLETIEHSWGTWNDFFRENIKLNINREIFDRILRNGIYKTISIAEFLSLNIENQRVNEYKRATTAEEAYPEHDRPRGQKDIDSVNYFLNTKECVSPIIIATVTDKNGLKHHIKLDGVHRLIAALIRNSPIKILFLDFDGCVL